MTKQFYTEALFIITCFVMANKAFLGMLLVQANSPINDAFNHVLQREQKYNTESLTEALHTNESATKVCVKFFDGCYDQ